MSGDPPAADRPWPGDAGARRLYEAVRESCGGGEDLPARMAAGLGAALDLLARDPELAWSVAVRPLIGNDEGAIGAHSEWIERFGDLLRDAAAEDPRVTTRSSFLAPFLIGGVRFQAARLVLRDEAHELPRLLPPLLEGLLAYYFEPGEPRRLAQAALAARR